MSSQEIIGLIVALLVMFFGLIGSVVPALPSTPLVLIAAVGHKLYFQQASLGWFAMSTLVGLTVFSLVVDYLATIYGARRFGAGRRGMIGAIVGGLVGIFFGLPGVLLGPFLGAALFELTGRRTFKDAWWAGVGATLGLLAGAFGKIACCLVMMLTFTASVLWHALRQ